MDFEKNTEKQGSPALDFFHEGKKYSIPQAKSAKELWPLLHNKILPALEKLKYEKKDQISHLEIGLCLAWFVREGEGFEDSNPEAADTIKEALRSAGFKIPDITNKSSRFTTTRGSFLDRKREDPFSYWDNLNSLFVLAPAHALALTEESTDDYLAHPERYEINLAINDGVAISLFDLTKDKKLRANDRVYNDELMDIIDRLIKIKPV